MSIFSTILKTYGAKTTEYYGPIQYEGPEGTPVLQFASTSEGYFDFVKNAYIYNYLDHLGNLRLSYRKNSAGALEILEESNYYPFGLKHEGYHGGSTATESYKYKFGGKELQESGMYDFGARMYMPDIGRWGVVDPLSEEYRRWSPYNYAVNNPIRFIDPDGRGVDDVIITGNKSQEALQQLQASVKGQLDLSMDSSGKVSAVQVSDGKLSQGASDLLLATVDRGVTVNVSATDNDFLSNGSAPLLGSFMGNGFTSSGSNPTVSTNQELNTDALTNLDNLNGVSGRSTLHETTESYIGGKLSQSTGNAVGPATPEDSSNPKSIYRMSHDRVVKQGGTINENFYNAQGQKINRTDPDFKPAKLIYTTGNNQPFHTVPKQ